MKCLFFVALLHKHRKVLLEERVETDCSLSGARNKLFRLRVSGRGWDGLVFVGSTSRTLDLNEISFVAMDNYVPSPGSIASRVSLQDIP